MKYLYLLILLCTAWETDVQDTGFPYFAGEKN